MSVFVSLDTLKEGTCYDASEGFVSDLVKITELPKGDTVAMLCGPPIMMKLSGKALLDKGMRRRPGLRLGGAPDVLRDRHLLPLHDRLEVHLQRRPGVPLGRAKGAHAVSEKLKVGVLDITGCNGCVLSVAFNEDEVLDIFNLVDVREYRFVSDPAEEKPEFDIVLMEGMVASPRDLEFLKDIRARTKVLVALGTCAHTGNIPAYRKWAPKENLARLQFEKTDDIADVELTPHRRPRQGGRHHPRLPAQPARDPRGHQEPGHRQGVPAVHHARLRRVPPEQQLLPARAQQALPRRRSPTGGCFAICVNAGLECWGCRGQTADANLPTLRQDAGGQGLQARLHRRADAHVRRPEDSCAEEATAG